MVEIRIGEKIYQINEEKANELIKTYKKPNLEKEAFSGILITIGSVVLGYFAMDIANRIASEIKWF